MKYHWIFTLLIATTGGLTVSVSAAAQRLPLELESTPSGDPGTPNVSSDSAPGWIPYVVQEQGLFQAASNYFGALDNGDYQRAYTMMAEIDRESSPFAQFVKENQSINLQLGSLKRRFVLKVTWTKDPAAAPFPGVYGAIDIAAQFTNADRYCGYLMLYQNPSSGDFEIMRDESNFIDNAAAAKIEKEQSRAKLDSLWATLAANCPNYLPVGN